MLFKLDQGDLVLTYGLFLYLSDAVVFYLTANCLRFWEKLVSTNTKFKNMSPLSILPLLPLGNTLHLYDLCEVKLALLQLLQHPGGFLLYK